MLSAKHPASLKEQCVVFKGIFLQEGNIILYRQQVLLREAAMLHLQKPQTDKPAPSHIRLLLLILVYIFIPP